MTTALSRERRRRCSSPTAPASTATVSASTGSALGEAVFYTGMTGYEEALTDPSYAGQILTFTYPMIGNYGVSGSAAQHGRPCAAGDVIKQIARHPSHHLSKQSLPSWLDEQRVPTLVGVDTRALTIALREHGTICAALAVGEPRFARGRRQARRVRAHGEYEAGSFPSVATRDAFVAEVGPARAIVLIDCGVKRAILRNSKRSVRA